MAASSRVVHNLPISVPSCVHASNNVGSCRPMKAKSVEYAYTKKRQSNIEKARAARWSNATAAVSCPYLPRLVYVSCMMRRRGSLVVISAVAGGVTTSSHDNASVISRGIIFHKMGARFSLLLLQAAVITPPALAEAQAPCSAPRHAHVPADMHCLCCRLTPRSDAHGLGLPARSPQR